MKHLFDSHLKSLTPESRVKLTELIQVIRNTTPGTEEVIAYGIPTFRYKGKNLIHVAGYKNHVGCYPGAAAIEACKGMLAGYKTSKGTVQFPLDKKIPASLVRKMILIRKRQLDDRSPKAAAATRPNREEFWSLLAAPAKRALEAKKIKTLKQLSACSEQELLSLHGFGPSALMMLRRVLKAEGLKFRSP